MNRPLFFAVSAFALGEVVCLFAKGWIQKGIVTIIMSFLFCLRFRKIKNKRRFIYFFMFVFGMMNMSIRGKLIVDDRINVLTSYDKYNITCKVETSDSELSKNITVQGIISDIIKKDGKTNIILKTKKERIIVYNVSDNVSIGETVSISGDRKDFQAAKNAGCFDLKRYYIAKNISYALYNPKIDIVTRKTNSYYITKRKLYNLKYSCVDMLYKYSDDKVAGIYAGLLFGEKGELDEDTKALYQNAGIAHILAISGLHVSLIGLGIFALLRKFGLMIPSSGFLSFVFLFLYGMMTGFGIATLRAIIMLSIYVYGLIWGRTYDMATSMSVALLIMLILNPNSIYDSGMVISYVAVAGVIIAKYVLKLLDRTKGFTRLRRKKRRIYSFACSFIISLSINMVTLPITMYYYYQIPLYSIFVNIIVLTLMRYVVISGILSVIISSFSIRLASYFMFPGKMILSIYSCLCDASARLPHSVVCVGKIHHSQIIVYYVMLLLAIAIWDRKISIKLFAKKKYVRLEFKKKAIISIFAISSLFAYEVAFYMLSYHEMVSFLDVGQGDAILIKPDINTSVVIDGGSSSEKNVGKNIICPMLKYYGMADVDFWFVSHADIDHVAGLIYILENRHCGIDIGCIVISSVYIESEDENYIKIKKLAEERKVDITYMNPGDVIGNDKYSFTCLYPNVVCGDDSNHNSMIISYESDNLKILFPGDADVEALNTLEQYDYDIIKVPHHGSKYSLCEKIYVGELKEDYKTAAIISCGKNNIYKHPHDEVISFLKNNSIDTYRTDYYGEIVVNVK